MGKGTIISHIADGQYNVTVNYNRDAITAMIANLLNKLAGLEALILEIQNLIELELLDTDPIPDPDPIPDDPEHDPDPEPDPIPPGTVAQTGNIN